MPALPFDAKTFIVRGLACYDSPSQVAEAVSNQFGIAVSRQQVETYDPGKVSGKGLAKRWVVLFNDTREQFRKEVAQIPIANRAYRLRALGRMLLKAEQSGNLVLATRLLELAAKETGEGFINHRARSPAGLESGPA